MNVKVYGNFEGRIGRTHAESEPWFEPAPHPGDGAPNVVVILLDDLGFSHLGCYGSSIDTPNIDRLAEGGLRYTNFHVTPLCSPTRAALLTGRNAHEVGMRSISNFRTGYPHQTGHVSNHAATVAEVLRDQGYATFAVGKWHLCQMADASAAGPYDQWPCQRGFDRFYGFLEGETDQFAPDLVYDNHRVNPPRTAAEGYHLSEDLVDKAIEFVHDSTSIRPDRPFLTYLAFGATHAPHQAPPEYLEKYRGAFDEGWDVTRAAWFARQQELGLLPEGTDLAPRNEGVVAWADMPENDRRLAARLQEAFAAFLDHTDVQIGRFIDALDEIGQLDNTVVVVLADNGASQEGGPYGVLHEMKFFNFILETPDEAIEHIDEIGGPHSHSNYPWGWAQTGNTPFRWYKQNTHEGGVHVPFIVHWPAGGLDAGAVRHQFHHVNDVVPTLYELIGVDAPEVYRGFEQMPVTGTSMAYTLAPDAASVPSTKTVQHFEMFGHRALYLDGWKAVTRHQPGTSFDDDRWELYHLDVDPSECHDLAAEQPERLEALIERWWSEATEHNVLPLDDRTVELFGARYDDHSPHPTNRRYTYRPPMAPLPSQVGPPLGGRSWEMIADIERPQGADGVLFASGTENSGLSLFVDEGHLVFDYNFFGTHSLVASDHPVPEGDSLVGVRFERAGREADVTLLIDGAEVGSMHLDAVMGIISSVGPSVGFDHGSPVSDRYAAPNPFQGRLRAVHIDADPSGKHRPDDEVLSLTEYLVAMARQ